MRLRWALFYFAVLLLVLAIIYTFSLMFVDDGLPLNTSGFRYPIA